MSEPKVSISSAGAVLLGEQVCCDGFYFGCPVRVQTHVHDDHMHDFASSKGFQTIYLTTPSKRFLINELDADLSERTNLIAIDYGAPVSVDGSVITFYPNNHMLGSTQVVVELENGHRIGYSGDFSWPIETVPELDALVVDGTCGKPQLTRKYSQEQAEQALVEIVVSALCSGAVHIKAARGTIHRALEILSGNTPFPMVASKSLISEIQIYREYGYGIDTVLCLDEDAAKEAIASRQYIRFFGRGDRLPIETSLVTSIALNAYVPEDAPVLMHSPTSYTVALSNHADFEETLEYVRRTGAKYVLTDASRSPNATSLASEIVARLGVKARASVLRRSYEWGH